MRESDPVIVARHGGRIAASTLLAAWRCRRDGVDGAGGAGGHPAGGRLGDMQELDVDASPPVAGVGIVFDSPQTHRNELGIAALAHRRRR